MAIKSPTTRTYRVINPQQEQLSEVETTHLVMDFSNDVGYVRQVYKDSNDDIQDIRFLKISGAKYSNFVSNAITSKVQGLNDLDENAVGVEIEEITRIDFFSTLRDS